MFPRWSTLIAVALATACTPDEQRAAPPASSSPAVDASKKPADPPVAPAKVVTPQGGDVKPAFEIVPPVFEFGVLQPNEVREAEFEVFNRSERPLQIARLATECSCLNLSWDRLPIAPGKSAKIRSKVTAVSSGQRATAAILYLTDPARSTVRVPFHYVIVPEVLLEPKSIEFGRTETGKPLEQKIRVSLSLPETIKDVPVLEPYLMHDLPITLTFDPPTITTTKRGIREWVAYLRLKLSSDRPVPAFMTTLVFDPKGSNAFRCSTMVPVGGEVVAAWYFERPVLAFGVVNVGTEVTKTLRFFWPGEVAPTVEKLESDNPAFTATQTLDQAKHCFVITVKCLAGKAGKLEGSIKLSTSLSGEPSILKVTATAK